MHELPDPLERLLSVRLPANTALRERLRAETSRFVVRRKRWQLIRSAAIAVAACVLLAVLAFAWRQRQSVSRPEFLVVQAPPAPEVDPPELPVPPPTVPPPSEPVSAEAREWQAFDSPRPADAYLDAGNRYAEQQDYASALRCYRAALASGGPREIDTNDNWLVMALKLDEGKER